MDRQRKIGALLSYINIIAKNLVNFMYTPFLLKYVGQADFGLFQMTNSVMVGLSLLSMGFSSAYVKFYISYKTKKDNKMLNKINGLYLILFLGISIISLVIGSILIMNAGNIFDKSLDARELKIIRSLMIIMVLDVSITFISSVFDSNITVNEQFVFQQSRQLMQTFLIPTICLPLVFIGFGVISVELTQFSITLIFLIININYCLKKLNMRFEFRNLPIHLLQSLATFSFFIFLNQMVDIVNNNAPNFILGMLKGASVVATFSIANQIKNMFFMLSTSLSSIFVPKINILVSKNESEESLTDLMIKVGRIQSTILFCVLGGFIIIGKYFITLWAGYKNIEAYTIIIVMVLPSIVPLSQNVGIEIQRAMNKHIFRSVTYSVFAIINLIITYFGALHFGLIGASMGYVISILIANGLLMNWYYQNKIHLNMKKYWSNAIKTAIPFIVTTFIFLVLTYFTKVNSFPKFIIIGICYLVTYIFIFLRFVATDSEKNIVKKIKVR